MSEANELDQTQTTQAVEVTLSANSVLVLEIPHALPGEAVERMHHHLRELLDRPGCQVLVLADGVTCKVLQRQAAEDTL